MNSLNNEELSLYLNEIGKYKLLSADEEYDLSLRLKNGDTIARKELIKANLRLVVSIAKKYNYKGVSFGEIVQEGNIALIRAVDKYNPLKGFKFSTYATECIKNAIEKYLRYNTSVHISRSILPLLWKYDYLMAKYYSENGDIPTDEELAALLDISLDKLNYLKSIEKEVLSLDMPFGNNSEEPLAEFIESKVEIEKDIFAEDLRNKIFEIMDDANLTQKQRDVIVECYGLNSGIIKSKSDFANEVGNSRQRIDQLEKKALEKIRILEYSNVKKNKASEP